VGFDLIFFSFLFFLRPQGMQNSNGGISLLQTADVASGSMTDLLQRQRGLALRSMNGS
jgi:flagellin-like hook-associated protein FlgL